MATESSKISRHEAAHETAETLARLILGDEQPPRWLTREQAIQDMVKQLRTLGQEQRSDYSDSEA